MAGEKAFSGNLPTVGNQRSAAEIKTALNELLGFINGVFSDSATAGNANEFLKTDGAGALAWDKAIRTNANLYNDNGAGVASQVLKNDGDGTLSWDYGILADAALRLTGGQGTAGQVLQSDGDGTASWTAVAPLTDGDKTDIVVSGGGTVWNIDTGAVNTAKLADDAVSFAKMQNIAENFLLGRESSGTGDIESIGVGNHNRLINGKLDPNALRAHFHGYSWSTAVVKNIIENSTSEYEFSGTAGFHVGLPDADWGTNWPSIGGGTIRNGALFKIKAIGYITTTGTPTMRLRVKYGGTTIIDTTAKSIAASGITGLVEIEAYVSFRGATEAIGNGFIRITDQATNTTYTLTSATETEVTVPSTGSTNTLAATFQWGTASPSNKAHFTNVFVERIY